MKRIVNVIYKPHLVTFRAYEETDYRCCTVCDYKVVVDTGEGELLVASVMDDTDLRGFDIDEAIKKIQDNTKKQDWFYPQELAVGINDINNFINGDIEQGSTPLEAIQRTFDAIRKSNCICTKEVDELLRKIDL